MVELGAVGFGEPPEQQLETQARWLAAALLPYLREAVESARNGRVTYDPRGIDLAFKTLDFLAPLIDKDDFEESEKLLLHGVFSWIVRSRQAGMLADRRMKIALAVTDVMVELYERAATLIKLEVDRSGDDAGDDRPG